jgi:pyruvate dehydrogenase E1 component alpha subunit
MESKSDTLTAAAPSVQQLRGFLRAMLRMRRLEERMAQLYGQGKIGGFCHLYIGQEAVAVGALACLRDEDYVVTTYRDHGIALEKGISAAAIFAELMGREAGCARGRGGSMHLFDRERNMMGGHGIVGSHIPLATGMAFASKYRAEDRVTLCFFGEGAVNNGGFHEALNLAALWKLPIVYICENNRYGMGTPIERASSIYDIHKKAEGYDMIHDVVDGMNVETVYQHMKPAVEAARQGKPSFLEIRTYRFRGHSMSDPIHSHYRTKEEVEEQKQQDPIAQLVHTLREQGQITEEEIEAMENEITREMKQAVEEASQSPEPHPRDVYLYTFSDLPAFATRPEDLEV